MATSLPNKTTLLALLFSFVLIQLIHPAAILAERVLMTDGSTVEGTILQQSRTTIQLRSADGRLFTIDKALIRKIEYGPTPDQRKQQEDARKAEADRKAEEARKAEEEKKAQQQEEARRIREEKEAKRADEERRQRESLPATAQARTWLEPYFAVGNGSYRSGAEQIFSMRVKTEDTASILQAVRTGGSTVTSDSQDEWTYNNTGTGNIGLRGGRNRWLGELDVRTFSAETSFGHAHTEANGTSLRGYGATPLTQTVSLLQVGYRFFESGESSVFAIGGMRTSRASASIGEVGFYYPNFALESVGGGTAILLNLRGPQVGLGWNLPLHSWPAILSFRVSLFSMTGTGTIHDLLLTPGGTSTLLTGADAQSRLQHTGEELSLQARYRWKEAVDVFAEIQIFSTTSKIKSTAGSAYIISSSGTPILVPMEAVQPALTAVSGSSQDARAEYFQGLRFGVTRRFEF